MISEFGWSQLIEAEISDVRRRVVPHVAVVWLGDTKIHPLHVYPVEYLGSRELIGVVSTLHESTTPEPVRWLSVVHCQFDGQHGWVVGTHKPDLKPRTVAIMLHIARENADAHALHGGVG